MPLMDITNPDIIKFLVENYDKTTRLRLKWNKLHSDKLQQAATLQREERGLYDLDVVKESLVAGMPTISRDHKIGASNRRLKAIRDTTHINCVEDLKKGHSIPEVGLGDPKDDPRLARPDTDLTRDPIMRPVDPKQKEIIYKDIPTFGRAAYLKSRYKMAPEKKFYFNECYGWDYGWRLGDSYFTKNAPQFGRVWRYTRGVLSRTGPHPDPIYYRDADEAVVSKCTY